MPDAVFTIYKAADVAEPGTTAELFYGYMVDSLPALDEVIRGIDVRASVNAECDQAVIDAVALQGGERLRVKVWMTRHRFDFRSQCHAEIDQIHSYYSSLNVVAGIPSPQAGCPVWGTGNAPARLRDPCRGQVSFFLLAAIRLRTCRGVSGICLTSTWNGRRASSTAATMAAGAGVVPPSPAPFAPSA